MVWLVICYDIPCDKRRTQLQKRLKGWLHPVQKSVFEGEIPPRRLDRLLAMVRHRVDLETDDVRVYVLCGGCRVSTLLLGRARPVPSDRDPIFV